MESASEERLQRDDRGFDPDVPTDGRGQAVGVPGDEPGFGETGTGIDVPADESGFGETGLEAQPVTPWHSVRTQLPDPDCETGCPVKSQLESRVDTHLRELSLLFDLGMAIYGARDAHDIFGIALRQLAEHMGMHRGTIAILNRESGLITIEEAYGLTDEEKARGIYRPGEGVIGKVVATGRPMVVPRISEEPLFLDRTKSRRRLDKRDISYICVPIRIGEEVVGALSADRLFTDGVNLDEDVGLLGVIAAMIARSVRSKQEKAEEFEQLRRENRDLRSELKDSFQLKNFVGGSRAMREVFRLILQVAPSSATVLVRGENGVGKEVAASAIHYHSPRADKPFIKVNCAALPETLIESELFGHEKGAFTGADRQRKGRFELAEGGTIFLDEIGDLPQATQVKLLRVLQERAFERLGGHETLHVDVRIVTATNRELEQLISEGRFREDLYYRINVFPVHMPPLRERKEDIPALVDHFVEKINLRMEKDIRRVSTPAIDMLMSYHWPGNVRELQNCLERAAILCNGDTIAAYHLPPTLQTPKEAPPGTRGPLLSVLEKMERELIFDALKLTNGNLTRAAEELGITERMMGIRVRKHGIDPRTLKDIVRP